MLRYLCCCLLPFAAAADQLTTTYVCVLPNGVKAMQDHACEGASQSGTIATVKHTPSTQQVFSDWGKEIGDRSRKMDCKNRRDALAAIVDRNRTETDKWMGNNEREQAKQLRAYIADNCTPYGI